MPNEQDKAVESAVAAMAAGAPSDWVSLRAVFTPVKAFATVDTALIETTAASATNAAKIASRTRDLRCRTAMLSR